MLIRSQDKESLVNLRNIESLDIIGFEKAQNEYFQSYESANIWKVTYSGYEKFSYIGEYTTKQEAINVLDMICNHYTESVVKAMKWPELYPLNPIFQMPLDSGV